MVQIQYSGSWCSLARRAFMATWGWPGAVAAGTPKGLYVVPSMLCEASEGDTLKSIGLWMLLVHINCMVLYIRLTHESYMSEGSCMVTLGTVHPRSVLNYFQFFYHKKTASKRVLENFKFPFISYLLSDKLSIEDNTVTYIYLPIYLCTCLCRVYFYRLPFIYLDWN